MPYIPHKDRAPTLREGPINAGEFNYFITCAIDNYLCAIDNYLVTEGLRYETINTIIGALECCKMEMYRRIAVPYEDIKIAENGDVYSRSNLVKSER